MDPATLASLSPETLALLRQHNLLIHLVRAEVIKAAVGSIPISEEEQTQLLLDYCNLRRVEPGPELDQHLSDAGLTRDDLFWQICLERRIMIYCEEHFSRKAEARFLSKKEQLDQIVYSLLRVKDPFLARELYLRIAGHEADFNGLAAEYSEGIERNTNGVVGPTPLARAHPVLAQRLQTTKPGQLIEPFEVEGWWLIARVERFAPARFEGQTAKQMARELFQEWVAEQSAAKMAVLD